MAQFKFAPLITDGEPVSTALGVSTVTKMTSSDNGKAVKLGPLQNYVLCATGDDIEGTQIGVEAHTVNGGFSFGSVKTEGMVEAQVAAAQTGALAIGDYVVSGIPTALNTAGPLMVIAGAGVAFKWRVIQHMTGTGVSGDKVLIQRI